MTRFIMANVTENDLLEYVDGRLDAERRAEVEDHLRTHPETAHRIAADLAILRGLRMIFGTHDQDDDTSSLLGSEAYFFSA